MSHDIGASPLSIDARNHIHRVFEQTVLRLRTERAPEEAEFFARAHLEFLQEHLGPEDAELEVPIANLAQLLSAQGKWVAARAFVRRLIHLRMVLHGAAHPSVKQSRLDLESLRMCTASAEVSP